MHHFDPDYESQVPIVMEQAGVSEDRAKELLSMNNYELVQAILKANDQEESLAGAQLRKKILGDLGEEEEEAEEEEEEEDGVLKWSCEGYSVDQSSGGEGVIEVRIPVPKGTKSKDIDCKISAAHLKVGLKGAEAPLIDSQLLHRVVADDSAWTLEGSNTVVVSFEKEESQVWKEFIRGEVRVKRQTLNREKFDEVLRDIWKHAQLFQVQLGGVLRPVWCKSASPCATPITLLDLFTFPPVSSCARRDKRDWDRHLALGVTQFPLLPVSGGG